MQSTDGPSAERLREGQTDGIFEYGPTQRGRLGSPVRSGPLGSKLHRGSSTGASLCVLLDFKNLENRCKKENTQPCGLVSWGEWHQGKSEAVQLRLNRLCVGALQNCVQSGIGFTLDKPKSVILTSPFSSSKMLPGLRS